MVWIAIYAGLIVLPVGVMALWPGAAAGRPWLMQLGVGCGFVAFAIFVLEFALIAKLRHVAAAFGMDGLVRLHGRMGVVATVLLCLHAGALIGNGYPVEWLKPWGEFATWEMRWGLVAAVALVGLVVTTLGRRRLRIAYEWWQWLHSILAKVVVGAGLAHLVLFGGFSSEFAMRVLLVGYLVLLVCVVSYFEVWRPIWVWRRPWVVAENEVISSDTRTLVLRPVGHGGFRFAPGQFAWLSTGSTPFHKDRHPVSMSSAPVGETVSFTVKNLGDWSGGVVPGLKAGDRVWVDGPYGVFTPDRVEGRGFVLIGGGVGVTPLVSMCETFAVRGEVRPVVFFYGSLNEASLRFRGRLESLSLRIGLKVVFALEKPGTDWTGERGYVDAALLRQHLPEEYREFQYFVCGPEAMMDAVEGALRELGVPRGRVHTERFVMV